MVGVGSASSDIAHRAPADYDELTRLYGAELRSLVRGQLGFRAGPEDVDDVLQYILTQFLVTDVISQYQPGHLSDYTGSPATFKAFIKAKAVLYCKGKREKLTRDEARELKIADAPVGDGTDRWIDQFGGAAAWDDYAVLSDGDAFERLRSFLAARPSGPGEVSLVDLLDSLAARVDSGDPIGPEAIRKEFGLTRADTASYMQRFRAELKEAARRDTYEVGGMVLTAPQVRAAIDALIAYNGHHVFPAFKVAGHPLQHAGKTWYIKFAKDEIRQFPELKQAPGGHFAGGHGNAVKAALVHRLERMLGGPVEGQESSVPPGPDAWRRVQHALRKLPGSTPDGIEFIMELARQVFQDAA